MSPRRRPPPHDLVATHEALYRILDATKTRTSRCVYLPEWLMEAIEATCPLEDRVPERRVFQGLHASAARQAMTCACWLAKIPHYSPHDLRHRRITIWHQSGVPARELAERAGHSRPSSLDVTRTSCPRTRALPSGFWTCSRGKRRT